MTDVPGAGKSAAERVTEPARTAGRETGCCPPTGARTTRTPRPPAVAGLIGNQAVGRLLAGSIHHERAADTIASHVTGRAAAAATPDDSSEASTLPSQAATARQLGVGTPLPPAIRRQFAATLGRDVGHVRVHDDARAASATAAARAHALAAGRDIAFAPGAYRPDTAEGRWTIAHEVAHTLQHTDDAVAGSAPVRRLPIDAPLRPWGVPRAPSDTELLEEALRTRDVATVKQIRNFGVADETQRLQLIDILLRQFWVGPADEAALERLWASFGDRLAEVADANIGLWNDSVDRGAELTGLPGVAAFIASFEQQAKTQTEEILADSAQRINAERIRYGLERVDEWTGTGDSVGGITRYERESTWSMAESSATFGIAEAARQLAAKRREVIDLGRQQQALVRGVFNQLDGEYYETITDQARYDELTTEIRATDNDYQILRASMESRFPILAAYQDDLSRLDSIATGPGGEAAEVLETTTRERLRNIATVRRRLEDESAVVWKLPTVLAATKARMGIADDSFRAGMVHAQVDRVETQRSLVELALGAVALGLGLLAAVPTGGGSLVAAGAAVTGAVGSAALSGYMVSESLREYQLQAAAAGTDFDKARAVASDEPSLFWLALDIVGLGLDLGAAVGVFRALAAPARAASAAGASDEAVELLADAARAQGGGDELAERVAANARRLRDAESVEQAVAPAGAVRTVDDVAAERVAQSFARASDADLARLGVVAEAAVGFGHEVKVVGGAFWRCSPTCTQLRELFAAQLAANPSLEQRLLALEGRAAGVSTEDAARALARDAAALESELRRLVPHIPGSALRPGFNAGELVAEFAVASGRSAADVEALFRLAGQLGDADMAALRRIVDDFADGRGLSDDAVAQLERMSQRVRTRSEEVLAEGRGALVRRDPFTGEPLMMGEEAHRRQRWFEYQQLHRDRFPETVADIDPGWSRQYDTILANARAGRGFEGEVLDAFGFPKNTDLMFMDPNMETARGFIPDSVLSGPRPVEWGQPYHFVEVKGWANMSDTGNLSVMLDYVEEFGGHITVVFRSEAHASGRTVVSGPLQRRLWALMAEGNATIRWHPPVGGSTP